MRHARSQPRSAETSDTVSERVIRAVADRDGVSALDISPPLFDAIEPDALDRLYHDGRCGVTTEFEYTGYRVTVTEGGQVELTAVDD